MEIRTAKQEDIKAINEIYNHAVQEKLTADISPLDFERTMHWFQQYDRRLYPVFVAIINDSVAGWLSFSPYRPGRMALRHTTEISYYVRKDYRRRKTGTELLDFVIKQAPLYNFKTLFAITLEHNEGSIKLLEKKGFERWGFMPGVADFDGKLSGHLYYGIRI
ncbi:MAG: N-acetyltransferase [Bacteroidia bacterium]|nr:N-acetyltransferase [Bacteroidia bacterium]